MRTRTRTRTWAPALTLTAALIAGGILVAGNAGADTRPRAAAPRAVGDAAGTGKAVDGCVDWPTDKFLQSPVSASANGGTGVANQNGSYFGEGFHVGCNVDSAMNQQYALDLGMAEGDEALAPGGAGTVVFAGQAPAGWQTCGLYVVVDHGDGWWSVTCHLSELTVSTGQQIANDTVIGLVGGTGGFAPHLHFSLMQGAHLTPEGGVFGGRSAQPRNMRHAGCGGAAYDTITKGMDVCH
jgi:murein DD-endopeptidase MepM/ murein hydrolase activator NlpD